MIHLCSLLGFLEHDQSQTTFFFFLIHISVSACHLNLSVSSSKMEYRRISDFFKQMVVFCTFFIHLGFTRQTCLFFAVETL